MSFLTRPLRLHAFRFLKYGAQARSSRASFATGTFASRPFIRRGGLIVGTVTGSALLFASSMIYADAVPDTSDSNEPRSSESLTSLLRAYFVYSVCSVPFIVDHAPAILDGLLAVPIIGHLTQTVVRHTFFAQFVGAETAEETLPLLHTFRAQNKGVLFAYSAEVSEHAASSTSSSTITKGTEFGDKKPAYKIIVDEMIHSIDVAADFEDSLKKVEEGTGRKTWVAIKMTALLPSADALARLSAHLIRNRPSGLASSNVPFPGTPLSSDLDILQDLPDATTLSPTSTLMNEDIVALRELLGDLQRICQRAKDRNIRIIIDAEHSWYQPAIDALTYALMRKFNALPPPPRMPIFSSTPPAAPPVQPLVYGTFQAYLRRNPAHLAAALADSRKHNYALGVKLVRGAYHPHELAAFSSPSHSPSISPESLPPVWLTKADTDACYNECLSVLVSELAKQRGGSIGVLFGTHNWDSCDRLLAELIKVGLATEEKGVGNLGVVRLKKGVADRVAVGQLLGMSDELTNYIVKRTRSDSPLVIKYVAYGSISDVMPYLARRAIENKSVLGNGGAAKEKKRAWNGIKTRMMGA